MNVWGILRTDEWLDPRLKQLQQQIKRESLEAFVGSADVSCLWFRLQCVGVGYTVPRCMGNAYFFLGDGGGELERYCVKSIITCVWKAGSFVGSRPCPERIFQDLLVGVAGNNERGDPPRVRGTSWENMPAACRRDVHVRARACARRRKGADRSDLIFQNDRPLNSVKGKQWSRVRVYCAFRNWKRRDRLTYCICLPIEIMLAIYRRIIRRTPGGDEHDCADSRARLG